MERTLVIFKPDCLQRRLVGRILARLEQKGLKIAAMKLMRIGKALAEEHYAPHRGKPFFEGVVKYISSAPVIAAVLEGVKAIEVVRGMMGPTRGTDAPPGTIRGDFGFSLKFNLLHGSDSPDSAQREIPLFFPPEEILDYRLADEDWIYEPRDEE